MKINGTQKHFNNSCPLESKSCYGSMAKECENHFKTKGCIVNIRNLYKLNFNPAKEKAVLLSYQTKPKLYFN